jgi:hypothetical protein
MSLYMVRMRSASAFEPITDERDTVVAVLLLGPAPLLQAVAKRGTRATATINRLIAAL